MEYKVPVPETLTPVDVPVKSNVFYIAGLLGLLFTGEEVISKNV